MDYNEWIAKPIEEMLVVNPATILELLQNAQEVNDNDQVQKLIDFFLTVVVGTMFMKSSDTKKVLSYKICESILSLVPKGSDANIFLYGAYIVANTYETTLYEYEKERDLAPKIIV